MNGYALVFLVSIFVFVVLRILCLQMFIGCCCSCSMPRAFYMLHVSRPYVPFIGFSRITFRFYLFEDLAFDYDAYIPTRLCLVVTLSSE